MGKAAVNRLELFNGKKGFYFRVVAENGEIIAQSEGYASKEMCKKGIKAIRQAMRKARVKDLTK